MDKLLAELNPTGIAFDSRNVTQGCIFVAVKGSAVNGEEFVQDAIAKGAIKVVVSETFSNPNIPQDKIVKVDNPRRLLALLAAQFYQKQPQHITSVTGTNGKTSVANFFKQFATLAGYKSASIGTLGIVADGMGFNNQDAMTSPDPIKLHQTLKTLKEYDIDYLGIEASSHGLDQYRLDGVNIQASGFTNLTRDHLDYHQDMESYFAAKLRLFTELTEEVAVLNADIPEYRALYKACRAKGLIIISYGDNGKELTLITRGANLLIDVFGHQYAVPFNLAGGFQVYNVLCALGLAIAVGLPTEKLIAKIPNLVAASGRLEKVATHNGAEIFVDYAHTPDALQNALSSLGEAQRLIVVFGCGGDRDPGKRAIMGEVAAKLADVIIVTDDNPRTEDPVVIRKQIMNGCPSATEIDGRAEAINYAIKNLQKGDMLLIAGKGHEEYQVIGREKSYFSDTEEVKKCIGEN
jgi:UDP-N-acetylmuramoyl-L-alanyl-D-glutamate--2,6-diaminopimelate ligase